MSFSGTDSLYDAILLPRDSLFTHDWHVSVYFRVVQCLKYKTDEQKDLKKLEAMDALMFRLMSANSVTDASTSMDLTGDDDEKTNRSRSNTQTNQDNNKKKQGKRRRKNKGGI